jgi:hypothetical protein
MRKYVSSAGSDKRLAFGYELHVGLQQSELTAPLAEPFGQINARLKERKLVREQAEEDQIPARVRLRYADETLDQTFRSAFRAAEIADGGKRGPIARAIFPDGLKSLVVPTGETQLAVSQQFITRAKVCSVPGVAPMLAEWLPRIEQATANFQAALQERDRLATARAVAVAAEEAAREDHERAIDKLMGEVRAIFPKDRRRWDLIFPELSGGSRAAAETESTPEQTTD